jgi:hypothetical protein
MRLVCQAMGPSAKDSETRTSSSLDGFIHHARRWRQVGPRAPLATSGPATARQPYRFSGCFRRWAVAAVETRLVFGMVIRLTLAGGLFSLRISHEKTLVFHTSPARRHSSLVHRMYFGRQS